MRQNMSVPEIFALIMIGLSLLLIIAGITWMLAGTSPSPQAGPAPVQRQAPATPQSDPSIPAERITPQPDPRPGR